jgi:hypothetical protein
LVERNALPVVAEHVEYFNRCPGDSDDFIPAVYDVAFSRDEDVFSLRKENSFGSARRRCVAIEF